MDKVTLLEKRLKEVKEAFEAMKKNGVDEELLIVYIMHKTKLSRRKVKEMLDCTEDFYEKLVGMEVAKAL